MMDYADFHGYKESRVVYDIYEVFELVTIPPAPKLRMFASNKFGVSERTSKRYLQLANCKYRFEVLSETPNLLLANILNFGAGGIVTNSNTS